MRHSPLARICLWALIAADCTSSWRRDPLLDAQRAPDIVGLHDVWTGAARVCVPAKQAEAPSGRPTTATWACTVAGWDSVQLTWQPGNPSTLELSAHTERSSACSLSRFSRDAVIVDSMEAAVVSGVTAALESGPFDGACLSLDHWYDRPQCDVTLFLPDRPRAPRGPPRPAPTGRQRCSTF